MKKVLLILFLICSSLSIFAQKEKVNIPNVDSATLIKSIGNKSCECIDSVDKAATDRKSKIDGIAKCIDDQVMAFQLIVKISATAALSKEKPEEKKQININIQPKGTREYQNYYYDLERWLKDNCTAMNRAITTNNEAGAKSFSSNAEATEAYNKGVGLLQKEQYAKALPFFEQAVAIDSEFAFAWDNLGVCARRTEQYEKAEKAYKESLRIDPAGKTPLQNLPVVYMLQNKTDEAINAYLDILRYYPGDAEVYYGIAVVYYTNKKDNEHALDYMCKAYNIYVEEKSPYRADAEKIINTIFKEMKQANKEETFYKILKENNIKPN
jgi:tetratricopeptide (TPR) repeat protein